MCIENDSHYEQTLLGLMPTRCCQRWIHCSTCGRKTRHALGFQKLPKLGDFTDVGRWYAKCVLCDAPLFYTSAALPPESLELVKKYYARRKHQGAIRSERTRENLKVDEDDEYDVDLGICLQLYTSTNTVQVLNLGIDRFPDVSLWDSPSIKNKYHGTDTAFQVFNPVIGHWEDLAGDQLFQFVPFTPVVARLKGVPDSKHIDACVDHARHSFAIATLPPRHAPPQRE